ncbi:MAG: hypothetical protein M0R21_12060 [Lentimicrobiaceae bacterium]|nr:hypothetical protein [Lentimicrobiaceae bacterium]
MLKSGCEARCPACSHRDFTMQQSLEQKYQWIEKQLSTWKEVLQTVQSVEENNRWGYRKKVCLSARYNDNFWKFGVVKRV